MKTENKLTQLEQDAINNGHQHVNFVEGDNWSGINKREHFSGLVMSNLVINGGVTEGGSIVRSPKRIAELSVMYADALLLELAKPNNNEKL